MPFSTIVIWPGIFLVEWLFSYLHYWYTYTNGYLVYMQIWFNILWDIPFSLICPFIKSTCLFNQSRDIFVCPHLLWVKQPPRFLRQLPTVMYDHVCVFGLLSASKENREFDLHSMRHRLWLLFMMRFVWHSIISWNSFVIVNKYFSNSSNKILLHDKMLQQLYS